MQRAVRVRNAVVRQDDGRADSCHLHRCLIRNRAHPRQGLLDLRLRTNDRDLPPARSGRLGTTISYGQHSPNCLMVRSGQSHCSDVQTILY